MEILNSDFVRIARRKCLFLKKNLSLRIRRLVLDSLMNINTSCISMYFLYTCCKILYIILSESLCVMNVLCTTNLLHQMYETSLYIYQFVFLFVLGYINTAFLTCEWLKLVIWGWGGGCALCTYCKFHTS